MKVFTLNIDNKELILNITQKLNKKNFADIDLKIILLDNRYNLVKN